MVMSRDITNLDWWETESKVMRAKDSRKTTKTVWETESTMGRADGMARIMRFFPTSPTHARSDTIMNRNSDREQNRALESPTPQNTTASATRHRYHKFHVG